MKTLMNTALVACLAATSLSARGQTTGWMPTGAGTYNYTNTAYWVDGNVNGIWDSTLTLTGAQTATFAEDTLVPSLTFGYAGAYNYVLRSDGTANRLLTLGGDISLETASGAATIGSTTAKNNLNINLGGATRTFNVNSGRTLVFPNVISNGGLNITGGGILTLNGANTFAEGLALKAGKLRLGNASALGAGTFNVGDTVGTTPVILESSVSLVNSKNNPQNWNQDFAFATTANLNLGTGVVTLAGSRAIDVTGKTLTVGGVIGGGTYSITKNGPGSLVLNGANTYGGGTIVNAGVMQFGPGAVPSTGSILINSAGTLDTGSAFSTIQEWLDSGRIDTASAGTLALNANSGDSIDFSAGAYDSLHFGASANATLSGTITAGPSGYLLGGGGSTLTLSGANALSGNSPVVIGGNVTLTAANSVSGTTTVGSGILTLANTSGALTNDDIVVKSGATLAIDSSISGVSGTTRAQSVTLQGGALTVTGNSGADSVDTITDALRVDAPSLNSGANVITLTSSTARNCRLAASSLVRTNNGVALVRGTNLGQNTLASATANSANLSLGTAPALIGGGGAVGSQNISIIPWAFGDTSAAGGGLSFVTYDAARGIRPLDTALEYAATITGGTITNSNVSLALGSTTTTVTGTATINSLMLSGTTGGNLAGGTDALTVSSGAIFAKLSGNGFTISKPLDFGSAQGVIGTSYWANYPYGLSISGGIAGSGGLVVYNSPAASSGANGVLITAATSYTGDTYVLGGLSARAANALPNGARAGDVYVFGNLGIPATSFTLAINGLYGTGNVGVHGTSQTATLTVGSNGSGGEFSGFLSGKLSLVKTGTGTQILSSIASTYYNGTTKIQDGILSVVTLNSVSNGVASSTMGAPVTLAHGTISLGNLATTGQLTVVGTGETSDRVINLAGTTGGGVLDASGTGPLVLTSAFTATGAGSKTLTLQGSSTHANAILGAIVNNSAVNKTSLLKTGPGLWVLGGTTTFTGGTTVNEGTLAGTGSLASDLSVASGATLAPGTPSTVGTFTVNADVDFEAGSTFDIDISGATADLLVVSGTVTGTVSVPVAEDQVGGEWKVMTAASFDGSFVPTNPKWALYTRNDGTELWLAKQIPSTIIIR